MKISTALLVLSFVFGLPVSGANASLIAYEFTLVVGGISSPQVATLNGNSIDGATLVATGLILNETDLNPDPSVGIFAATTTYDFGPFGSFTTDVGADFYYQFQSGPNQTGPASQFGLVSNLNHGLRLQNSAFAPLADPNVPEAIGAVRYDGIGGPYGDCRIQTNLAGDTLDMCAFSYTPSGTNVNITPVPIPEPSTASLLALGLVGITAGRRRAARAQ